MDFKTPLVLGIACFVLLPGTFFSIGKPRRAQTAAIHAVLFGLVASVLQPLLGLHREGFQTDGSGNNILPPPPPPTAAPTFTTLLNNPTHPPKFLSTFGIKAPTGVNPIKWPLPTGPAAPLSNTKTNSMICDQVIDLMGYCPSGMCNASVYATPHPIAGSSSDTYLLLYEQTPSTGKIIQTSDCKNIVYADKDGNLTGYISNATSSGPAGNFGPNGLSGYFVPIKNGVEKFDEIMPIPSHPNYKANTFVVPKSVDTKPRVTYTAPTTGLGTAAIVGIVIGSVVGLGLLIAFLMYFMKPSSTTQ